MDVGLVLGAAVGAVGAGVLIRWRQRVVDWVARLVRFLGEVRAEVKKVTWPGWDELKKSTVVIIVFVIIMGLIIGLMDLLFSLILVDFLGRLFA
jgi:preprotein translocase subunit SecE